MGEEGGGRILNVLTWTLRLILPFQLPLRQKIAIAAVVRNWAKAQIYFVLSAYPGLKSGAIV
jgi:hypothetical protein